jgi:hypothetical protein
VSYRRARLSPSSSQFSIRIRVLSLRPRDAIALATSQYRCSDNARR